MPERRFIEAGSLPSSMHRERADADRPRLRCRNTIELDGMVYRCWREHVDGIHDAFATHDDGGLVRW
jgi:hypothetical protein